jgi:hypothetical protein
MADDQNDAKPQRSQRKRAASSKSKTPSKTPSKKRRADPRLELSSPRSTGRPSKHSDDVEQQLYEALSRGMSTTGACGLVGITPQTLRNWMADPAKQAFAARMCAAQSACEARMLDVIHAAAATGDTKAATWLLERTMPDDYGRGRRRRPDPPTEQERAEIQDPPQLTMETMQATWIRALQVAEAEFAAGRLDPQHYLTTVTRLSGLSGRALEIASRQADVAEVPPLQISVSLDSPAMVESPTPSAAPGMCGDVIEVS